MVNTQIVHELLEVRRRMVVDGLGLKPRELRRVLGFSSCQVSYVLGGDRQLRPEERARLERLVRERMRMLFG